MKCDLKFYILVRTLFESGTSDSASDIGGRFMNFINKYKGFDNLLFLCLGHVEELIVEGKDLGVYSFVFFYSDFSEEFPEEFDEFSFVSEYNFMEMLSQYIDYEYDSFVCKYKTFDKDKVVLHVESRGAIDEFN